MHVELQAKQSCRLPGPFHRSISLFNEALTHRQMRVRALRPPQGREVNCSAFMASSSVTAASISTRRSEAALSSKLRLRKTWAPVRLDNLATRRSAMRPSELAAVSKAEHSCCCCWPGVDMPTTRPAKDSAKKDCVSACVCARGRWRVKNWRKGRRKVSGCQDNLSEKESIDRIAIRKLQLSLLKHSRIWPIISVKAYL